MTELTFAEMSKRILNVSLKDKDHLLNWLEESDRHWLIFNSRELVESLPFPEGVDDLMRVIACYRERRRQLPSGHTEKQRDPILGKQVEVMRMKDEQLEVEELDRVIRFCIRAITELDPKWKIDSAPR